jgi:hypothetical protein
MDVHPSGDHLIVGGYDRKLCWFDLELSEKPYKILRYVKRILCDCLRLANIVCTRQISFTGDPIFAISPVISVVCIVFR